MDLPKFLIADNDDYPENTYVVHTQTPRFIIDVDTEEYEIMDGSLTDQKLLSELLVEAIGFYEDELDRYEEDDE
ncbi:hypothetical protein LJC00_01340 [Dysgonomonas sp. OttesenSCG-928-M03]|nr:hypothetical protein [Dysgonomonas sp. OttesenSCG-928-M03]